MFLSSFNVTKTEDSLINGYNGLIQKEVSKYSVRCCVELFDGNQEAYSVYVGLGGNTVLAESAMNDIIASIRLRGKPIKSAQEFYKEGLVLFKSKKYEEGAYTYYAIPFSPEMKQKLIAKYGNDLDMILNEELEKGIECPPK